VVEFRFSVNEALGSISCSKEKKTKLA
jgi:hypothetical protein